jgi:putative spermidine/putrescine transport system permease protein/mannopine transport system permease protein
MAAIETAQRPKPWVRPWTPARGYALLLIAPAVVLAVFFIWPLIQVVIRSIVEPEIGLGNYVRIFGTATYLRVIANTMTLAATVALVTLVLAYPVAWMVSAAHGKTLYLCLAMILIPFWTSVVIRTFSWMVLFQRRGVLNSFLLSTGLVDQPLRLMHNSIGVHIGMVHILLPFMILPLLSAMRAIDPTIMRAASVLGANPLRQFVHVYLPLTMPGVSAGFALVFISALGFFITPALLGGPQNMTIAVLIEQQTSRLLDWPMASALASLLLAATALLYLLYDRISRHLGAAGVFGG